MDNMDNMSGTSRICTSAAGISRREFGISAGMAVAGLAFRSLPVPAQGFPVALVHGKERTAALKTAFDLLGGLDPEGRDVYIKANYSSADPFPATTHPITLEVVVSLLREGRCGTITLVERSCMGATRDIWNALGVPELARKLGVRLLALDEMQAGEWRREDLPAGNWKSGIEIPGFLDRDACLIQIANLKTHRFGGIFSASLKNTIGLVAKYGFINPGYNYMQELHASPRQGAMIAEVNLACRPRIVIMDATQVFMDGGPETGAIAKPEVILASSDRVAVDAAGVALLRLQLEVPGQPVSFRTVFEQEQLKRAADLGLGAKNGNEIQFLTGDPHSSVLASQLEGIVQETPKKK